MTNLSRLRDLLSSNHERVSSELSDNKHVDHLTKYYHNLIIVGKDANNKQGGKIDAATAASKQVKQHPDDLDEEALEFIEEMRRRR